MTKSKSSFVCQQCGYSQVGWFGKCPECGTWNSSVETVTTTSQRKQGKEQRVEAKKPISLISIPTKT